MGATSLYHPVSLHVIRGAMEYCGWKAGKIEQKSSDFANTNAVYTVQIVSMPKALAIYGATIVAKQLQHCFAEDITVKMAYQSRFGQWYARIECNAGMQQLELPTEEDLQPDGMF